jgi:four helix bundle protein
MKENNGVQGLAIYQLAFENAMKIYDLSKKFPSEEKYSLTDQLRRSSRSICANIAEAFRHKKYLNAYSHKLTIADAECSETIVWLDFARNCKFIDENEYAHLKGKTEQIGRILGAMINKTSPP